MRAEQEQLRAPSLADYLAYQQLQRPEPPIQVFTEFAAPNSSRPVFINELAAQLVTTTPPRIEEMPEESPRYATPRSLLYLLRRLKKEGEELVNNTTATYWTWFNKTIETIAANRYNIPEWEHWGWPTARNILIQQVLDQIGEITGIHLVSKTSNGLIRREMGGYWLKKDCKSYWIKAGMQWVIKETWDEWRQSGTIVWAADVNEWVSRNTMVLVYEPKKNNTGSPVFPSTQIALIKNRHKEYDVCPSCGTRWHKQHFKFNKWIELIVCPSCNHQHQSAPKNRPHNFQTIWGEYHSHSNSWQFHAQRLGTQDAKDLPMGVEIEMNLKSGIYHEVAPTMWKLYEAQIEHNPDWHNFYTERDGSLSEKGSVEFITNPMTLLYHQKYWEFMLPEIRKYCVGWNVDKFFEEEERKASNYGIHITCHRKYWPDLAIARLMKFLELETNKEFVYAIAQRRRLYRGWNLAKHPNPKIANLTLIKDKRLSASEHYSPVYLKSNNLMEIRIFNSTLNQESFLKNLEFVDSFRKWCNETAFTLDYTKFLQWLGSHYSHEKRYPNLLSYLGKPTFGCKHGRPVINTWSSLLVSRPLGQLTLFEPTAEVEGLEDQAHVFDNSN